MKNRPAGWSYDKRRRALHRTIVCKGFTSAVRLIGKIARLAEKMDHHPDLHLTRYKRLKIVLTTHSEGRVTGKDVRMARTVSRMAAS